mmetsp:Transcript_117800/g.293771  ORF Transcript_117800/g.293771 Transcript_117800/m.293771 type:complete len:378 (-) Transcript_117800:587-1720(-)
MSQELSSAMARHKSMHNNGIRNFRKARARIARSALLQYGRRIILAMTLLTLCAAWLIEYSSKFVSGLLLSYSMMEGSLNPERSAGPQEQMVKYSCVTTSGTLDNRTLMVCTLFPSTFVSPECRTTPSENSLPEWQTTPSHSFLALYNKQAPHKMWAESLSNFNVIASTVSRLAASSKSMASAPLASCSVDATASCTTLLCMLLPCHSRASDASSNMTRHLTFCIRDLGAPREEAESKAADLSADLDASASRSSTASICTLALAPKTFCKLLSNVAPSRSASSLKFRPRLRTFLGTEVVSRIPSFLPAFRIEDALGAGAGAASCRAEGGGKSCCGEGIGNVPAVGGKLSESALLADACAASPPLRSEENLGTCRSPSS